MSLRPFDDRTAQWLRKVLWPRHLRSTGTQDDLARQPNEAILALRQQVTAAEAGQGRQAWAAIGSSEIGHCVAAFARPARAKALMLGSIVRESVALRIVLASSS
jgi:hypothetical protein